VILLAEQRIDPSRVRRMDATVEDQGPPEIVRPSLPVAAGLVAAAEALQRAAFFG
jgi:hypothetical protein